MPENSSIFHSSLNILKLSLCLEIVNLSNSQMFILLVVYYNKITKTILRDFIILLFYDCELN